MMNVELWGHVLASCDPDMRSSLRASCKGVAQASMPLAAGVHQLRGMLCVRTPGSNSSDLVGKSFSGLKGVLNRVHDASSNSSARIQLCILVAPDSPQTLKGVGLSGSELVQAFTSLQGAKATALVAGLDLCFIETGVDMSIEALQAISQTFPNMSHFNLAVQWPGEVSSVYNLELPTSQSLWAALLPNLQHFGYSVRDRHERVSGGLLGFAEQCEALAYELVAQRPGRVTSISSRLSSRSVYSLTHRTTLCGVGLQHLVVERECFSSEDSDALLDSQRSTVQQAASTLLSMDLPYRLIEWATVEGLHFPLLKHLAVREDRLAVLYNDTALVSRYFGEQLETLELDAMVLNGCVRYEQDEDGEVIDWDVLVVGEHRFGARQIMIHCSSDMWYRDIQPNIAFLALAVTPSVQRITLLNCPPLHEKHAAAARALGLEKIGFLGASDEGGGCATWHGQEWSQLIGGGVERVVWNGLYESGACCDVNAKGEIWAERLQEEPGAELVLWATNLLWLKNYMCIARVVRAQLGLGQYYRVMVVGGWPSSYMLPKL